MSTAPQHNHHYWMAKAIQQAKKGLYTTHPNPRVGCVLVRDSQLVAEGYHKFAGEGHAEVNAIANANGDTQGCTAYVTLEPCSHQGKTGPCAKALIKAKVSRLVYGMQDPNPEVAGRGLAMLKEAGIEVIGPVMEAEALALNPGFIKRMTDGLPYVRLKLAMSLDGRTAMESGESQWITGPDARLDVQKMRAQSDAIVTGIGSVISDDPSMTVRIDSDNLPAKSKNVRQPKRIIMDTALSIPPESKILYPSNEVQIFCLENLVEADHQKSLVKKGVEVTYAEEAEEGGIDLVAAMESLADQGINEVLVETGAVLAGSFLQEGLVDEVVLYMAPKLLGSNARPLMQLPLDSMDQAVDFEMVNLSQLGKDIKLTLKPCYEDEEEG
ncbi:bifunctional diaminohydroxyphosphoribosylaminopyrimidine deaminase/5-amino-6-(5-phosphoribosylamino)uracil reductase RibD [Marinomonas sp. PE14-40]|uniref:bifunctional diaminohydroxyphosphoribosylaminopyrimidine deaminase/5-amino-6-(5-phosphoribosylamino)uracil reductase RibD n=1 Tax=Marinomonas sp. PE14-40 TaxID=3060621 RepID=UPI003F66A1B5